jgi:uncharacterized protein
MTKTHCPHHIEYIEFPVSGADELTRTQAFFTHVFGWSYKSWGDDYADTTSSGVGNGLNADATHRPTQPLVVIYSDDIQATRATIIAEGGTITRDIFAFPGGQRFHFKEPGGNELAVWSES